MDGRRGDGFNTHAADTRDRAVYTARMMDNLSTLTERAPDLTQNITRFLDDSDLISLTSTNKTLNKFGHVDGKTVRNKVLEPYRDIATVGANWMSNQLEHESNVGGERENWEEEGGVDWEGERNPHYFKTKTFNPKFTEDFLRNEITGGNWVPPIEQSIRNRVLAQQQIRT